MICRIPSLARSTRLAILLASFVVLLAPAGFADPMISSGPVESQPGTPPSCITPELREQLLRASRNDSLSPWQREFMAKLAGDARPDVAEPIRPNPAPEGAQGVAVSGNWSVLVPAISGYLSAIYDPLRDRVVVFGGMVGASISETSSNEVWALSLSGTPTWTKLTPSGTPPSPRWGHSAIYDPVRDQMIVFGGYGAAEFNDVWALTLSGSPTWTLITPSGTPPSARSGHSGIYDPVRDQMLIFGGGYFLTDVWAMSLSGTPAWTQVTPAGTPPGGRRYHTAIYDPVRDRMIVFAGQRYNFIFPSDYWNDTWALSLAGTPSWSALTPAGIPPSARSEQTAIYDSANDRMIVFAGEYYNWSSFVRTTYNDTYALSLSGGTTWTQLSPSGSAPWQRFGHNAIYDAARHRMVTFGGSDGVFDLWALSLSGAPAWSALATPSPAAGQRYSYPAIYDPVRDRMLVLDGGWFWFGQHPYGTQLDNVYALSLAGSPAWTSLSPLGTSPGARSGPSGIYDPPRNRVLVFGGINSTTYLNDVWALSLAGTPTWSKLTPGGTPPHVRAGHTAIYDPVRDRMIVFGGWYYDTATQYLGDVWALSLSGSPAWAQLTPTGGPPGNRSGHGAIYDPVRDRMLLFGGESSSTVHLNDVWALSLSGAPGWTMLTPSGTPPGVRTGPGVVYDSYRDRMVLFGGYYNASGGHYLNDAWELLLAGDPVWRPLAPTGVTPKERVYLGAIYDPVRDRMVTFGGEGSSYMCDGVLSMEWHHVVTAVDPGSAPDEARLLSTWPSPATGPVSVRLAVPRRGVVSVDILDVSGRKLRTLARGTLDAGVHTLKWDGKDESGRSLRAGVYLCTARVEESRLSRMIVVVR